MSPGPTSTGPTPTFRDPAGSLRLEGDSALRTVHPHAREAVLAFLASPLRRRLEQSGAMVATTLDDADAPNGLTLRHPRLAFVSYPWEWTPSQWRAAADLTLDLCEDALAEGWALKDANPLNILFAGPRPVLVDVLSFEPLQPGNAIWLPYAQYMRTFLLPLLMLRLLHWPLALTLFKRDGYEPADVYAALSWQQRLTRAAFFPVTLAALLERKSSGAAPPAAPPKDPGLAVHLLRNTFRGLRARTHRAAPHTQAPSEWSDYTATRGHYSNAESAEKLAWVRGVLEQLQPKRVLDIGANTGEFSALAAGLGAEVVALERDAAAADRLFLMSRERALNILTLHTDLARPTPAAGWDTAEHTALLLRLEGRFDLVLMLAVIHHLLLMEQIPLRAIIALLHRLTTRHLVLEWVPATDPMFQSLLRGRDALYGHLTESHLDAACAGLFRRVERQPLANGRVLLLLERLAA